MLNLKQHHKLDTSTTEESPLFSSITTNHERRGTNKQVFGDHQTNSMNTDRTTEPIWKLVSMNYELAPKENLEEKVVVLTCQKRVVLTSSHRIGRSGAEKQRFQESS